jgi:hypothetical protein
MFKSSPEPKRCLTIINNIHDCLSCEKGCDSLKASITIVLDELHESLNVYFSHIAKFKLNKQTIYNLTPQLHRAIGD